jgi:DNA polymerase/3'-5' exonuclease PolX
MSGGQAIPYAEALAAAKDLRSLLAVACDRMEIAGSVRRRKPSVHDLELVAIPTIDEAESGDLWGTPVIVNRLEDRIAGLIDRSVIEPRRVVVNRADGTVEESRRMGAAYKALVYQGLPVDLFITDAERWGCIFALRTGPGDWNTRLVTDCKRYFRSVADGRVLHLGKPVPTPEEADFFRALGVPWVEPQDRHVDRLRFDPDLLAAGAR